MESGDKPGAAAEPLVHPSLLQREAFAAPGFDPWRYVNSVTSRALAAVPHPEAKESTGQPKVMTPEEARGVANDLVDALSEALDGVVALRTAESARRDMLRHRCMVVEAEEKAKLSRVRAKTDSVASQLRDLEAQITSAASATAGIEDALHTASARASRGRHVLQLVQYFENLLAIEAKDLREQLDALAAARKEARVRACSHWRSTMLTVPVGTDVSPVSAESFFTLPETRTTAITTAEKVAAAFGIPDEMASRASTPAALELLKKLSRLSSQLRVPNVENVQLVVNWFTRQLIMDVEALLTAYYEVYEACTPTCPSRVVVPPATAAAATDKKAGSSRSSSAESTQSSKVSSPAAAPEGEDASSGSPLGRGGAVGRGRGRGRRFAAAVRKAKEAADEAEKGEKNSGDGENPSVGANPSDAASPAPEESAAAKRALSGFASLRARSAEGRRSRGASVKSKGPSGDPSGSTAPRGSQSNGSFGRRDGSEAPLLDPVAVEQGEKALRSPYVRQLLASLDMLARMLSNLSGSSAMLQEYYLSRSVRLLDTDCQAHFALPPLPPTVPVVPPVAAAQHLRFELLDGFPARKELVEKAFRFVRDRLRRESLVVVTLFPGDAHLALQLCTKAVNPVLASYIARARSAAEKHRTAVAERDGRLSPRSRRRAANGYVDATVYLLSLQTLFLAQLQSFVDRLPSSAVHPMLQGVANPAWGLGSEPVGPTVAVRNDSNALLGSKDGGEDSGSGLGGANPAFAGLVDEIFDQREEYVSSHVEEELFDRTCQAINDEYAAELTLKASEGPPDVVPAHAEKYRRILTAAESAVKRAVAFAPPGKRVSVVRLLSHSLIAGLLDFVLEHLKAAHDAVKADMPNWGRLFHAARESAAVAAATPTTAPSAAPATAIKPTHAAARIVLWAQVVVASLLRFVDQHVVPFYSSDVTLQADIEGSLAERLRPANQMAAGVATLCGQSVVLRGLAILAAEQQKKDFTLSDADMGTPKMAEPTSAARHFSSFVQSELMELRPILDAFSAEDTTGHGSTIFAVGGHRRTASGQQPQPGTPDAHSGPRGGTPSHGGHRRTASLGVGYAASPTTPSASADPAGCSASTNTHADATAGTDIAIATLSSVSASSAHAAFRGMSMGRQISTGLYQGLTAHVRQFTVTDAGALLFKRDMQAYTDAIRPLLEVTKSYQERRAIHIQFDLLREVANLLMMPLDHINAVRTSGLLRHLHKDEVTAYLKMRADVRRALKELD